ncbi:MAG: CDGSH iron-sulfur domain-containing protein [Spirochaetes bacterium]|nr:CDGSH iron-sulfur domain-containing protein [Spirochaetota bacterium]
MPNIIRIEKNGHIAHLVTPEVGEKLMLCRCYKSSKFPLCDLAHAKLEGEVGPLIVEGPKAAAESKP